MIANVSKHHATKMPYEIGRLAQHIAGGLLVTAPSQQDLDSPEIGCVVRQYRKRIKEIDVENCVRILRLIDNLTLSRNTAGYLTESMHGAGSPQAQRIQIARQVQKTFKKQLARTLAGIDPGVAYEVHDERSGHMARVFESTGTEPDS